MSKAAHVFVVGSSRSGTTMMSRMMNVHSSIYAFNELHFFEQLCSADNLDKAITDKEKLALAKKLLAIQRDNYLLYSDTEKYAEDAQSLLQSTELSSYVDLFQSFLRYESMQNGKTVSCDHTPRNIFYIEEILKHMPKAKVVVMLRDGRDVLLSQKRKWKRKFLGYSKIPYKEAFRSYVNYHPIVITQLWSAAVQAALAYKDHERVHHVRYEDIVSDPEREMRKIMEFLEIDFEEAQLQIPFEGSSNQSDEKHKKGVDPRRKHAWKSGGLKKAEVYWCERIGQKSLKAHGYELEGVSYSVRALYYMMTLPMVLGFALLLNLNRMKNVVEAIKKRLG